MPQNQSENVYVIQVYVGAAEYAPTAHSITSNAPASQELSRKRHL